MAQQVNFSSRVRGLAGRTVFVTGHTGFKGSWLSLWLAQLGANVHGFSLKPPTTPSLFELACVRDSLAGHTEADIRDADALTKAMQAAQPDLVIHLAAQPLVRVSYAEPADTWAANVLGTVNLLEAVRACPSVKAAVVITTDKVYENREWAWGYREIDPLGGYDPYSASKAATELAVSSWRRSFFEKGEVLLASARAGNVIGGGDWSAERLIPDAARAAAAGQELICRNPNATRPWQHVLCALHGYLLLAAGLLENDKKLATAFNFGPAHNDNLSVGEMLSVLQRHWPGLQWRVEREKNAPHEANSLYLDASQATRLLDWRPAWNLPEALAATAAWYQAVSKDDARARDCCLAEINAYADLVDGAAAQEQALYRYSNENH